MHGQTLFWPHAYETWQRVLHALYLSIIMCMHNQGLHYVVLLNQVQLWTEWLIQLSYVTGVYDVGCYLS